MPGRAGHDRGGNLSVALVVPIDSQGHDAHEDERLRNWSWLRRRWLELHPEWELVVQSAPPMFPWVKGQVVNVGVEHTRADVLVIADADVLTHDGALVSTVRAVEAGASQWGVPFRDVYRLNEPRTRDLIRLDPATIIPLELGRRDLDRAVYRGKAGGGIVVVTRAAFETVNGMDDRFVGWGGEDKAFGHALRTLAGDPTRAKANLWHLWHPPSHHIGPGLTNPPANEALLTRYRHALKQPDTMRELVLEHS